MPPTHDDRPSELDQQVAACLSYTRQYCRAAARRGASKLRERFPEARITLDAENQVGEMQIDGEDPVPVFIAVYPDFVQQRVVADISTQRRAIGGNGGVVLSVGPTDVSEQVASRYEHHPVPNATVYVWALDLKETEDGFEWERG